MRRTKIIPLGKSASKDILSRYTNAAWSFAHTILWPEQTFSKEELQLSLEYILAYLAEASDKKRAFTAFCERVILTHQYLSRDSTRFVPNPSTWFNRNYEHGFAGTKRWYQKMQNRREDVPTYLQQIALVAEHYVSYSIKPCAKIFQSCRHQLLSLNAENMLPYFYHTILHFTMQ